MKQDRCTAYWLINLLIFIASVAVMFVIAAGADEKINDGVFYVFPKRTFGNTLVTKDIDKLENIFSYTDTNMSYETIGGLQLNSDLMSAFAKVLYTNADYVYMNRLVFVDGWFFAEYQETQDVTVLSEALAWKLFGSVQVSGEYVTIGDTQYQIVGVISQNDMAEENYFAWLPLNRKASGTYVECLYIQPGPGGYDKISDYKAVNAALENISKDNRNFQITDMNEYSLSILRRPITGLSFFGIYIICVLVLRIIGTIKQAPEDMRFSGRIIALVAVHAAIIMGIVYLINFEIWIPGFNGGGIKQLYMTFTNAGLLPTADYLSYSLLRLKNLNAYSNTAFVFCFIALINMVFMTKAVKNKVQY